MKVNSRLIALMVAMAAGTAAAANPTGVSAGTNAGLAIKNVAQATFDDPSNPGTQAPTQYSNPVYTTVTAIPAFDILYTDNSEKDDTTAAVPAPSYNKVALPGSFVTTNYTVVNNGNVDNYVVNITSERTTNLPAANVKYYLATDTTFSTPITNLNPVTLANGGQVEIVQRIEIPLTAAAATSTTPAETFSASPHGNAPTGTVTYTVPAGTSPVTPAQTFTTTYSAVDENSNKNLDNSTPPVAVANVNGDLEYTKVTTFTPTVVNFPTTPTDPTNPTTPSTPGTTVVTPPTVNPVDPTNPVSPPGTPTDPSDPSKPGYLDPTNPTPTPTTPGTPIVVDPTGNNQIAYPPADSDGPIATPIYVADKVTFNNVVSTPVVTGTPADTVNLFPTAPGGGAPTSVYNTTTNSFPITTPNGPGTVQFLDPVTKLPLPTQTTTVGGVTYTFPVLTIPAGGGSAAYLTVVTYPDSNTVTNPVPVVITVGVDSKNDPDVNSNATTTDTILPPAAAFGDVPASGTTANPALIGPGNAAQTVVPGTSASTGAPVVGTDIDSSAVFPMTINNTGEYNDTYTLSGTVTIKNADGTTTPVTVKYVDASGNPLSSGAVTGTYVTPLVPANSDYVVYAIIDVPATAAATTGSGTGINPNPLVSQTAVGNFSTITMTDTTKDEIKIGVIGGITVAKTQNANNTGYVNTQVSVLPKQSLSYKILAKNAYNSPVYNFVLADGSANGNNAYANTDFVSASATALLADGTTSFGTVYYKVNGGTFTTTAPAAGTVITSIEVAVDNSAPTGIDAADFVPVGATIELTINTTVK